jgi:hypothetical protein
MTIDEQFFWNLGGRFQSFRELGYLSQYSDRLDDQGPIPGRGKIFLFSAAFRPDLGPTHPPVQWILGALSLE